MVAQSPATDFHTAHFRKLQGIPHQVTYDLGKTHTVYHQTALRQPFYKLHLNARGMRAHILRRADFINQRVYIHFSIVIFQGICLNLRIVQQVIDQLQQRVLVIINLFQESHTGFSVQIIHFGKHGCKAYNSIQRSTYFVSHISYESILQLIGFFGNLIDALQRLQPFALADGNDYHDDQEQNDNHSKTVY